MIRTRESSREWGHPLVRSVASKTTADAAAKVSGSYSITAVCLNNRFSFSDMYCTACTSYFSYLLLLLLLPSSRSAYRLKIRYFFIMSGDPRDYPSTFKYFHQTSCAYNHHQANNKRRKLSPAELITSTRAQTTAGYSLHDNITVLPHLPDEIIVLVLSKLKCTKSLLLVTRVCKNWNFIAYSAKHLWETLDFSLSNHSSPLDDPSQPNFATTNLLPSYYTYDRAIPFSIPLHIDDSDLHLHQNYFQFSHWGHQYPYHLDHSIHHSLYSTSNDHKRNYRLTNTTVNRLLLHTGSNLKHICLAGCPNVHPDILRVISRNCPKLDSLCFSGFETLQNSHKKKWHRTLQQNLIYVVENCVALSSLTLKALDSLHVAAILQSWAELRHAKGMPCIARNLALINCTHKIGPFLTLSTSLQQHRKFSAQHLDLSGSDLYLTSYVFNFLNAASLEALRLDRSDFYQTELRHDVKFSNLKNVQIRNANLCVSFLSRIVRASHDVRILDISGSRLRHDSSFSRVFERSCFAKIEQLYLADITTISDNNVAYIAQMVGNTLKVLDLSRCTLLTKNLLGTQPAHDSAASLSMYGKQKQPIPLPSIQELKLNGTKITPEAIYIWMNNGYGKHLKQIELNDCSGISKGHVENLRRKGVPACSNAIS